MDDSDLPKDFKGSQEQFQKFMESAREHGCNESAEAFEAKLKRIAKAQPPKDDKIKKSGQ